MKLQIDKLGKVAVTIEKDYWDVNKDYDKLTIVQVEDAFGTYISRKPVLAGTVLTDREYWIPFSSLREDIVLDYNSFKAKYDLELSDIKKVLELHTKDITTLRETQAQLTSDINLTLEQVQEMIRTANTTLSTARAAVITANRTSDYVKQKLTEFEDSKGAPNGIATLDDSGYVPSSQLPSYVDDVLEFDNVSDFPTPGESGKIYVALSTENTYRWSGTKYVEISKSLALGETSSTAYAGDKGKKNAEDINKVKTTINSLPLKLVEEITYSSNKTSGVLDANTYNKTINGTYENTGLTRVNIPSATTEKAGLESAADKAKLDSLPDKLVTNVITAATDKNIVIHKHTTTKQEDDTYKEPAIESITIPGVNSAYAGVMLPKDKIKLDSLSNDSFNLWEEIENYTSNDDPVTGNKIFPYIFSLTQPKYRQKRILFKAYYFAGENKDVKIDCIALYVGENPSDDTCWKDYDNWILVSTGTRTEDVLLQEQLDSLPNTFYTLNSSEVNSTNGATFIFDKHECQRDGKYVTTENAITTIIPMVETSGASNNATLAGLLSFRQLGALSSIPINIVSNIQIESNDTNVNIKLDKNNATKIEKIPAFHPSTSETIEFPKASSNSAGVMSAADKALIDSLPNVIVTSLETQPSHDMITFVLKGKSKNGTNNYVVEQNLASITLSAAPAGGSTAGLLSSFDKYCLDTMRKCAQTLPSNIINNITVDSRPTYTAINFDKTSKKQLTDCGTIYNALEHKSVNLPIASSSNAGIITSETFNKINSFEEFTNTIDEAIFPVIIANAFKPTIYIMDGTTDKLVSLGSFVPTSYYEYPDDLKLRFEFNAPKLFDGEDIKITLTTQYNDIPSTTTIINFTYQKDIPGGNWVITQPGFAEDILKSKGQAFSINIKIENETEAVVCYEGIIVLQQEHVNPLPTSYTINQKGTIIDPDEIVSNNFIKYSDSITAGNIDLGCNGINNTDIDIDSFKSAYEHVHRYVGLQKEDKIYIKELSPNMQTFTDGTDATKYINSNEPNIDIWTAFDVDIYYRVDTINDLHTVTVAVEDKYIDKTDKAWILWPKFTLIGSYKAYVQTLEDGSKIAKSKSGVIPTSDSKNNFDTYIANRGAGFSHINYDALKFMSFLGYGFLGTTDNGNTIGHGTYNVPSDWSACYPKKTGLTNAYSVTNTKNTRDMTDPLCGTSNVNSITAEVMAGEGDTIKSINFFGLENWWGDSYEYLDGPVSMKFTRADTESANPNRFVQDYLTSKNIDLNNNTYNSFGEDKWVAEITYDTGSNVKTELLNNTNFEANASKYCVAIIDEAKHLVRFIVNDFTQVMSGCVTKIVGGDRADIIYKAIDSSKSSDILYCTNASYYFPNNVSNNQYKFLKSYLSNKTRGLIGCYDGNNNQNIGYAYNCARIMFTNTNNVILVEPNKSL
jgi:hypothetical protein